ncbi:hypothetical protein ACWC09_39885 [Streptomyces sp. NPDC001617]
MADLTRRGLLGAAAIGVPALAVPALATPAVASSSSGRQRSGFQQELENTKDFHIADFVAWNNKDMDMQRHYHAADVVVEWGGVRTEGVEPHIEAMHQFQVEAPNALVVTHQPNVARGDWTATIGGIPAMGVRMATVAQWQGGQIIREILFMRELPAEEAPRPTVRPTLMLTNPDNEDLRRAAGVYPGWSCAIHGSALGSRTVSFTRREKGLIVEQYVFAE